MRTILFCLPYAGGGATFYRTWPPQPLPELFIEPVQLPGREELFDDPWPASVEAAADVVVDYVLTVAGATDRIALLGHSFGAVLAFEVARRLSVDRARPPVHLFASGSADPTASLGRNSAALPDDEFIARVEQIAGYRHPALAEPELREILLPVLRADVALHESYRADPEPRLSTPITAVRGVNDHIVSAADCAGWKRVTEAGCAVVELPGGHMYLADNPAPLLELVHRTLAGGEPLR